MAPYCYRCPFNRAKPERIDARENRKCNWECLAQVEKVFRAQKRRRGPYSGFIFEPLMQGAAGMIPQPVGWLSKACGIAREQGALLVADEVMTAFGRTGTARGLQTAARASEPQSILASHQEEVSPDFVCLAKGLTGGYVPMAATLTTEPVFNAFLGRYEDFKTFFHGHSFTGNQIGAAAALASLKLLKDRSQVRARLQLERVFEQKLNTLWKRSRVGDVRRVGLVAGVELVKDWRTREPFALTDRAGIRVCERMARRGVLTRSIGNVIVLMPPYCTTAEQLNRTIEVLSRSIRDELGD
jgi:adenosylmethionine-8-amino-7-oxononanoate aminotransferase